jgi:hypothetical protein
MLPFASPMLMQGAAAGGGGAGSMSAGPTLRAQSISAFTSGNPIDVALPAGSLLNDLMICYGSSISAHAGFASGQTLESAGTISGTGLCSEVYWKRLDRVDIANGYLRCAYSGAGDAILGIIVLPNASVDGSSVIPAGAPNSQAGATWSGSGSTGTATCAGATVMARWNGILTVGQDYHFTCSYNKTGGAQIRISNGATNGSNVVYTSETLANGTSTFDLYFTATGTYFALEAAAATFSGTISNIDVKPATIGPKIRAVTASLDGLSTASSRTVNADTSAQIGDYALMFGSTKSNMAVAISGSPGSAVHSLSNVKGSGVARIGTLLAAGTFPESVDYSAGSPNGEFGTIILIRP